MGYQDPKLEPVRHDNDLSMRGPADSKPVISTSEFLAIFDCAFAELRGDEARLASLRFDVVTAASEGRVRQALEQAITGAANLVRA